MTDTKDDLIERLERRAASLRRVAEGAVRVNGAIAVMGEALQANTDADLHDEAARALRASAGREMVTDAMVERAARAIHRRKYGEWYEGPCSLTDSQRECMEDARAALSTPDGWQSMETALQDARKFIARFDGNMPTASEDEGVFALLERIDEALATRPRDEGED